MRRRGQTKGIFCVEGLWDPDLSLDDGDREVLQVELERGQ